MLVRLDAVCAKFKGQRHRSRFTLTGGKCLFFSDTDAVHWLQSEK